MVVDRNQRNKLVGLVVAEMLTRCRCGATIGWLWEAEPTSQLHTSKKRKAGKMDNKLAFPNVGECMEKMIRKDTINEIADAIDNLDFYTTEEVCEEGERNDIWIKASHVTAMLKSRTEPKL